MLWKRRVIWKTHFMVRSSPQVRIILNSHIDFTCVCILDAFKNETASKAMERVLKLVSEKKAKEIMKVK